MLNDVVPIFSVKDIIRFDRIANLSTISWNTEEVIDLLEGQIHFDLTFCCSSTFHLGCIDGEFSLTFGFPIISSTELLNISNSLVSLSLNEEILLIFGVLAVFRTVVFDNDFHEILYRMIE